MRNPLSHQLGRLATDRWLRQSMRTLLRSIWIGLSLCCLLLGAHLILNWPLRYDLLGALLLAPVVVAVLLMLRPRMSHQQVARRLDRRFNLGEQLSTALEIAPTNPSAGSVAARLLEESTRNAAQVRRYIYTRQRKPWSEVLTILALLVVLAGLWIMLGLGGGASAIASLPLPQLAGPQDSSETFPDEQPQPQPGQQSGQQAGNGPSSAVPGGSESLQAIADALRDQSATRAAADALDQGDAAGAASSLRELADQASQLSQESRNDLADALRDAANDINQANPDLADRLREDANNLEQGSQQAAEALEDLARAVEEQAPQNPQANAGQQGQQGEQGQQGQQGDQQGQQGEGQGEQGQQSDQQGQGQGQQGEGEGQNGQGQSPGAGNGNTNVPGEQREQPSDRLNVPGVPLDLEAEGDGSTPAQGRQDGQAAPSSNQSGFTQGGGRDSGTVQTGDDPLRIPIEDRDVVQDYFSPPE